MQNDIYQESTQNIPIFQRMNQMKSNVMSRFYNYTNSQCPQPRLYHKKPMTILGTLINPHIQSVPSSDFTNVFTTHMGSHELLSSLIYFVYRKDFPEIPSTTLTTDCGWGCAIRSCQMMLANAIVKVFGKDTVPIKSVIQQFLDFYHVKCPFSIHSFFTTPSILKSSINGTSYLPISICCVALTELVNRDADERFQCCLVKDSIELETISKPTIVFIPYSIPDNFNDKLQIIFKNPMFCGMVAGCKQKAFYFFGIHEDQLLLLDPHIVKQPIQFIESFNEKECIANLNDIRCLKLKDLESFVTFSFCVTSTQQLNELKELAKNILGVYKKEINLKPKEACNGFEILEF